MLTYDADRATRLTGTSASDCDITMMRKVDHSPLEALAEVANALYHLNAQGLEKKAHRQALMKAGRAALKKLGEV
ncbi:hypothetical protein MLC59_01915 [Marinobacter bryozoorum]|uniref:hypothetical protein n=1 Tax=Marinobacter bryozoorum TaxID=256324 RepID=UPI0020044D33|nr:hypothetical protein [Marinobacter bryozoorum]MCK7542926.1 hypothetical protein [Marinobacter bryozoorum]